MSLTLILCLSSLIASSLGHGGHFGGNAHALRRAHYENMLRARQAASANLVASAAASSPSASLPGPPPGSTLHISATTSFSQAPAGAPPASTPAAPAGTGATSIAAPVGGTNPSVPVAAPPSTSFSFSLASTNPTAVPLSDIVSNAPSAATSPISSTPTAGAVPTYMSGAPPLPNVATLVPSAYPPMDTPPPTDSPEVQAWIQEVQNSGIPVGDLSPSIDSPLGACPGNPSLVANDTGRCWWTCSGCTRDTDITNCSDKNTWGLTYDDGPSPYTTQLLDYLSDQKLQATFFTVGSRCLEYPEILQAEYLAGHQIAVHTWSHPSLTTLSTEEIIAELGWSRKIIKDVLGVTPNMMRPPYGDIDDRVRNISLALGLVPVMWTRISETMTFDTGDFNTHSGLDTAPEVLQNWDYILGNETQINTGFIVLEHDLFQQTVEIATGYILPDALAHQPPFTIQPVITCQHEPMSNAYVETNNNASHPPPVSFNNATSTSGSGSSGSGGSGGSGGNSGAISLSNSMSSMSILLLVTAIFGTFL